MTPPHPAHRTFGETAMNSLQAIAEHWRTEGHVIAEEPVPVRVDVTVGDSPVKAIEIIGERDIETHAYLARAYDDNGAMTLMRVQIDQVGAWHFTGGGDIAPAGRVDDDAVGAQAVRSTLRVAADRQTMTAFWERTHDGETWQPWMDIRSLAADHQHAADSRHGARRGLLHAAPTDRLHAYERFTPFRATPDGAVPPSAWRHPNNKPAPYLVPGHGPRRPRD
jgi:hypothetical protein